MTIIKPKHLRKGDLIGLIAPASAPSSHEKIEKGAAYLERLGYRVRLGKYINNSHGYLADSDEKRAEDFNSMVRDKQVKAIFSIRGGYGTPRLLQSIDYRSLKQNPKIIVGYSDITALQLAIFRKVGLITFSGPMTGVEMWKDIDPYTEEHFWQVVTSTKKVGVLENKSNDPINVLRHGSGHGRLLGGTFSLLASVLATPFQPTLRGSILIVEDIEEAPHRVDRMLAQLLNAGILRRLSALVFGKFTDCIPPDTSEPSLTLEQVQEEYAEKVKCPVITNFQYGHIPAKLTIPLGLQAKIDTHRNRIEVTESAVI